MKTTLAGGGMRRFAIVCLLSLSLAGCVTINTQPVAVSVPAGQVATFSVSATSSTNTAMTYQWYRNGTAISGATSATYSFTTTTADNGATFYVSVNDNSEAVQSSTVTLTVTEALASLSLLAGSAGGPGSFDGTGTAARFFNPSAVAVDSSGNSYVADSENNTIRKVSSSGVVTTLAGTAGITGSADGTGSAASFNGPQAIAVDASGNVYVADTTNQTIRKITPAGVVTTLAGTVGKSGSADGTGTAASFSNPEGLAVDASGDVYVADTNNQTIREITAAGVVSTVAGVAGTAGAVDGIGSAARFNFPHGMAIDSGGNLYIADYSNYTIRKMTGAGSVTTYAGTTGVSTSIDGNPGTFDNPEGVAVASNGTVYVADTFGQRIRAVSSNGTISAVAGSTYQAGYADGSGSAALFSSPASLAWDPTSSSLVVADGNNNVLRRVTTAGAVTTFAGQAGLTGTGTSSYFDFPKGLASDAAGDLFVADMDNGVVREYSSGGVLSVAASGFQAPVAVAVDSSGALYVTDTSAGILYKVVGGVSTRLLTNLRGVFGVAVDSSGNVYVADTYNEVIRKVTPAGVSSVLAGQVGVAGSTNGTGTAASFNTPEGLAVDSSGNVYVADTNNDSVREITPAGVVTTVATGLVVPQQLTVDSAGDIYVSVSGNVGVTVGQTHAVMKITSAGVVTYAVGHGNGTIGVGLGSLSSLVDPQGVAILPGGQLGIVSWQALLKTTGL